MYSLNARGTRSEQNVPETGRTSNASTTWDATLPRGRQQVLSSVGPEVLVVFRYSRTVAIATVGSLTISIIIATTVVCCGGSCALCGEGGAESHSPPYCRKGQQPLVALRSCPPERVFGYRHPTRWDASNLPPPLGALLSSVL
ncbi:hypothetical protein AGIG_G12762 [Arapaima gigas]